MRHCPVLNILHITGALSGGGAERQLSLLLKHLPTVKHTVFTLNGGKESSDEGLSVRVVTRSSRTGWGELFHLLREIEPDIVHCWIPATLPYTLPAVYAYGRQKTLVVAGMRSAYRFTNWQRWLQYFLYGRIDRIVSNVHPENMISAYQKMYETKQGRFISNGLDFAPLENSPKSTPDVLAQGLKEPFILYAGRLIPDKNLQVLLTAITKLPQFSLVICGEGALRGGLQQFCLEHGISDRVFFVGYRKDIYGIMKSARTFVLPSLREGMPNVAFEALAAGCRLVLSDIPVHRSWFSEYAGARFFPPTNVDDLTSVIAETMAEKEALPQASALLSSLKPEAFASNYHDFYHDVLAERAGKKYP